MLRLKALAGTRTECPNQCSYTESFFGNLALHFTLPPLAENHLQPSSSLSTTLTLCRFFFGGLCPGMSSDAVSSIKPLPPPSSSSSASSSSEDSTTCARFRRRDTAISDSASDSSESLSSASPATLDASEDLDPDGCDDASFSLPDSSSELPSGGASHPASTGSTY